MFLSGGRGCGSICADIEQGRLTDRWFVGAMALLAACRPDKLREIFLSSRYSVKGLYLLKLYKISHGFVYVHIDDRIPCDWSGCPLHSRCHNTNVTWVMLLEKAYAKLHGSFIALRRGNYAYGLLDLTGGIAASVEVVDSREAALCEAWHTITTAISCGAVVGCSSPPVRPWAQVQRGKSRIASGRVYAIIDARGARPRHQSSVAMLRLFSPWSLASHNSKRLGLRQLVGLPISTAARRSTRGEDAHTFWVTWAEFAEMFSCIHICHFIAAHASQVKGLSCDRPVEDPQNMIALRLTGVWHADKKGPMLQGALSEVAFATTVTEDTHFIAVLHQSDARWGGPNSVNRQDVAPCGALHPINVTVAPATVGERGATVASLASSREFLCRRDVACVTLLHKGCYNVVCSVRELSAKQCFTLSLAATNPVEIVQQSGTGTGKAFSGDHKKGNILDLPRALRPNNNDIIEYAASREIQGLQRTVGQLAKSLQDIAQAIADLGLKMSCLEEITIRHFPPRRMM